MKIWTSEHTFDHPWETVAQAAWRKYPNPMVPSVIGADVIDRKVVEGVLHTHRLVVSTQWGFPKWTQALTFGNYIAVDEAVKYIPHPDDPNKTLLRQEAVVTVRGVPLTNYMEDLLASKISFNANKGRQGLQWVINKLESEMKEFA
ncbi:protein slowmo isoform X2 [Ooceraea biroi]|uniref:protein slowmo isoform X2 n=1 Tax=Ooceraea biroi TaxID=2015173 RepID=UPI0005BAD77C|nr:protein slowmo isoform X2 [Ooceraea biroi]